MIVLGKDLPTQPATLITSTEEALDYISLLEKELKNSTIPGIGLALSQLGINKSLAICRIPYNNKMIKINLVNPKFLEGDDLMIFNEGCLSFPNENTKTIRFNQIMLETMDFYDKTSISIDKRRKIILEDLPAVCAAHEGAHLWGLTMFDFSPIVVGRNDMCPCDSKKKSKKCHDFKYYNENINKMFAPGFLNT